MRRFVIFILALCFLNAYAASRIIFHWPLAQAHQGLAWLGALVFFLLQLASPFISWRFMPAGREGRSALTAALNWASYGAFGLMSLLVVYGLATDFVNLAWKLAAPAADPERIDDWTFILLAALTAVTLIVGAAQAHMGPAVVRVDVPLKNLAPAFDGFTIAQVSDLHVGPTIRKGYAQKVVDIVNGLTPDAIALTGDFIDGTVPDLAPHVAPLAGLKARHGVYFVTGNHEYYWNDHAWIAEFRRLGARVLLNEHEIIRKDGTAIVIAGVTDYSTAHMHRHDASDPKKAFAEAPKDAPKILLAHQPATYAAAEAAGADLQISGHAHGGQYFPFSLVIRFFQRYYKGLNRYKNMWIYVNKGTGYWGPPLRFGVPSEITLFTLRPEKR